MSDIQSIGHKIAAARKQMNMSQAQLAQRLFISSQAVGKWERGESMPDITTFSRLADILGVDLNYFTDNVQAAATEPVLSAPSVVLSPVPVPEKPRLNWDMSRGNWVDADFSGLKGLHEKFSGSNMQRCRFIGSSLSGLLLKNNNIDKCDFSNADISASQFQHSHLLKNVFKDSSLAATTFSNCHIKGCDCSGADFTGAKFTAGAFEHNIIADAIWNRTTFLEMYIGHIIFSGTMEDCYFDNCSFSSVTFQDAILTNTFFKNKSLKRIRFVDCQADRMTYEFLKNGKADLTGITLLTN